MVGYSYIGLIVQRSMGGALHHISGYRISLAQQAQRKRSAFEPRRWLGNGECGQHRGFLTTSPLVNRVLSIGYGNADAVAENAAFFGTELFAFGDLIFSNTGESSTMAVSGHGEHKERAVLGSPYVVHPWLLPSPLVHFEKCTDGSTQHHKPKPRTSQTRADRVFSAFEMRSPPRQVLQWHVLRHITS